MEKGKAESFIYESIITSIITGKIDEIEQIVNTNFKIMGKNVGYDRVNVLKKFIENSRYDMFQIVIKYIHIDIFDINHNDTLLISLIKDLDKRDMYHNSMTENRILYVLDYVKDIDREDRLGRTALFNFVVFLCRHELDENKIKILKKMLDLGAIIYHSVPDDNDVICRAIYNTDILKIILENALIDGVKGIKSLDIGILFDSFYNHCSYDVIELLLPYIDDINQVDNNGNNIAYHVRESYNISPEIQELLIENGARLD